MKLPKKSNFFENLPWKIEILLGNHLKKSKFCPEKSIFFVCEIAWKIPNFSEMFLQNRFFYPDPRPQISNQIDAAGSPTPMLPFWQIGHWFISRPSVSSTVRLIWDITQIENISLVRTLNRDCVNIKSATWHHSEARLHYRPTRLSIVELTLLLLFLCGMISAHVHPTCWNGLLCF